MSNAKPPSDEPDRRSPHRPREDDDLHRPREDDDLHRPREDGVLHRPREENDLDRPSEDDVARQRLGGPKGSPELKPAPMTRQRRIKTPESDTEPGHTA